MTVGRIKLRAVLLFGLLGLALVPLKAAYWPSGSSNMLVATDETPVRGVLVCSDTDVLWHIVAARAEGQPDLKDVAYGAVPDGFIQRAPAQGVPRPFRTGEYVQVHVLTGTHNMAEAGRATGPHSFLDQVWFDGPYQGNAADAKCARP